MILCVDNEALEVSENVQKQVNLEEILLKHTKYYNSVEEAFEDKYVPLDFCVSVRSTYSNKVMQINKDKIYTVLGVTEELPHKGYDLVMYLASISLMLNVDYKQGFDNLMVSHSTLSPIGLYNPIPFISNPVIYTHIILTDEGAERMCDYLKEGREFVSIESIKADSKKCKAYINTLVIVKEENNIEE